MNPKLAIHNLDKNITVEELETCLSKNYDGVLKVWVMRPAPFEPRGWAMVEVATPQSASFIEEHLPKHVFRREAEELILIEKPANQSEPSLMVKVYRSATLKPRRYVEPSNEYSSVGSEKRLGVFIK